LPEQAAAQPDRAQDDQHRDPEEHRERPRARIADGGDDPVDEDYGGEDARRHAERRAEEEIAQPDMGGAGHQVQHRERRRRDHAQHRHGEHIPLSEAPADPFEPGSGESVYRIASEHPGELEVGGGARQCPAQGVDEPQPRAEDQPVAAEITIARSNRSASSLRSRDRKPAACTAAISASSGRMVSNTSRTFFASIDFPPPPDPGVDARRSHARRRCKGAAASCSNY
jgi:hypothetical protein